MKNSDESQREMKRKSLDELFEAKNINQDLTLLKDALINGWDLQPILEDYRQDLGNKTMRLIEEVVNSDIVRKIYGKNRGSQRERSPQEKWEGKEGQIDARRNQLDQLFAQKAQLKRDFADLKRALLENKDISPIMKFYEQQLGKKELTALRSLLQSKEFQDWKKLAENKSKRKKLDELFNHPDLKQDYGELKERILQRGDISLLMEYFEQELSIKQLRTLKSIISSKDLRELFEGGQAGKKGPRQESQDQINHQRAIQIKELFKQMKSDASQLMNAVLRYEPYEEIIERYGEEFIPRQFKLLKEIIKSQRFKKLLRREEINDQKESARKINQLFSNKNIKSDISELISAIIARTDLTKIMERLEDETPPKEFRIIQSIVSSKQVKELLTPGVKEKEKKLKLDELFRHFKTDVQRLKQALLNQQDLTQLLKSYEEEEMPKKEFNQLKNILSSNRLSEILGYDSKETNGLKSKKKIQFTHVQSQKLTLIEKLFQEAGLRSKIPQMFQLKKAIVKEEQYIEPLKRLSENLLGNEYLKVQNLIKSRNFKIELKKVEITQFKEKFEQLQSLIRGINFKKMELLECILCNLDCNSILEEIQQTETPQNLREFNQSIQSKNYRRFFEKNNIIEPIIQKKHVLHIRDKYYFIAQGTPLAQIRIKYQIADNYKFFKLNDELIVVEENFTESMKLIKCSQFSIIFQGETKQILLPYNIKLNDAKPIIRKILRTTLEIIILVFKDEKFIQQKGDFILQTCSSKRLLISYFVNLIVTLNQEGEDRQFKVMSHKIVIEVKETIADAVGIKKQAQKWHIDNKEILNNKETLQNLGIDSEYFRITIIEFKSLEYYGFTKHIEIKRSHFKDFFIEDDEIFCQTITKSKFPADEYSEVFRNQILGYIFAAIKKHSLIESSLNHIRSLVQSTSKKEQLWKPPSSNQKFYFNETFVLYYILRCSEKSLRIDILRGMIGNSPVPLVYYDEKGQFVELMEENYWIQNKAFNIVSFGLGEVMGKSDLLNIIFETSFKNRDRMHKQCQGGIEVQYNIYKSDQYSVNLIDISNDISEDVKLSLANASNFVIIQTKKEEGEVKTWINQRKFNVPVILIFRDVQNAFQSNKGLFRSQLKKNNDNNIDFNEFYIIPHPLAKINFYDTQINEIANGVQQLVRKNYQKLTAENLWKFTDFLAKRTNQQYVKFNEILKDIESTKDNLTKISNYFYQYKIIESEIDKHKEQQNIKKMDQIKQQALREGLADPLKAIISFYRRNFTLSSQIMCKIRIFLTLLRSELFREFNHLDDLLKDAGKKKEGNEFQAAKSLIVDKLRTIKELKDSLTTPEFKNQIDNFISKAAGFKSTRDQEWEKIIKIIKNQFEFQIQPKAFSVQNFWRQIVYMSKFDPNYEFKVDAETIRLTDAIINLGRKEVQDSQNFEVINGDLLEMPTEYLQRIFEHQKNKKVMVVAIFGPQSSGKSTLLNFVLGCDFMSSAGRCTKGIYGTYFQISNRQMPNCESILVLDTEGLFSNYENNRFTNRSGFDNKLVLFCLQVCDLIILNTKGDVTKECQDILEAAYDSDILDINNLPELYFVLNLNGGEINTTQSNQVGKLCDAIIAANPEASKVVCKDHAIGMPMAFNQIPRKSTALFVAKYLKPKTLPSQRFYKQTKKLCYSLMELLTERGREKQGRTLQEVFVKMDQTWSTINKYPILTKHGNKKVKLLEEKINQWKKDTKQHFINLQTDFEEDLKKRKLSQIEAWGQQKQKILFDEIEKAGIQFQNKFPSIPGELVINNCIKKASIELEPTLSNFIQTLKHLIHVKKFEEEIRQSHSKGFDDINFALKSIKQAQTQSKQKISEEYKIQKFQQCWAVRQAEMMKKIDRRVLAEESYQNTLGMYNGELQAQKKSKGKIQIPPHSLKDYYELQMDSFKEQLLQKFTQSTENQKIFQSSNNAPVMNIQKKQGDLNFKYLDMSKYFQNRSTPIFIQIDVNDLRNSLDLQKINRETQDGLVKQNLNDWFVNSLWEDFQKLGVSIRRQKIKQVTEYQISSFLYRFVFSKKQLSANDILNFHPGYQQQINKSNQYYGDNNRSYNGNYFNNNYNNFRVHGDNGAYGGYNGSQDGRNNRKNVPKTSFIKIFPYFIEPNDRLNQQQRAEKAKIMSSLKYLSKISEFQNQFRKFIKSQSKTGYQQYSNRLIAINIAKLAINHYIKSLDKSNTNQKKKQLQRNIMEHIARDLQSINLVLDCPSIDKRQQINFLSIKDHHQFVNLEQFKNLLSKFSRYWQNRNLDKVYSCESQQQAYSSWKITVGFFRRKDISVKEEYANRPILRKYINKQYNEFLNQMKRNDFTEFIKQELKYESVFDDIHEFAEQQKLEERDLNQAIQKIKTYTNELVQDINNDLKQVSQTVIYDFVAELHFFSCHLLWKMREQNEWKKKEKIIASFNEKKEEELKRFLKLASGQPHLQNLGCAQKIVDLYVQKLNQLIKQNREKRKKDMKNTFKRTYTRDYVQIKIDEELNGMIMDQKERQDRIYRYLLTPVEYFKEKYEGYYDTAVKDLKNYKYLQQTNLIQDLLESVIEFRDRTESQQLCITDQIFQGSIIETKEIYFIPLFVQVLNKNHSPYISSENKLGLKIRPGKKFSIQKIMRERENKIFLETLLNQKIMITNLKILLNGLANILQELRVSNKGINVEYTAEEISDFRLSLTVNICTAACPCCKRNCDVDMEADPDHTKHQCDYGHQMRAIRGMRMESYQNNKLQYKASIQRCEDLENYSTFNFNGKDYSWQQFKKERESEWELNFPVKNRNEAFFSLYWKIVGRRICDYYIQLDNLPMDYVEYSRQNINKLSKLPIRPTNYIFALDQSYSMEGNSWDELVQATRSSVSDISAQNKFKNQYLSIFKFNSSTTPVCEFVAPESFNVAQITFGGGCTYFTPAFRLGRQIIERHPSVDNVFVLISDGEAEYPQSEIPNIIQLQASAKASNKKVEYVSILIGRGGSIMETIKKDLNGRHNNVANASSVASIFREILKAQQ